MEFDDPLGLHLMHRRHVVQVRAKLTAVANGNFHVPWRGQFHFMESSKNFAQLSFQFFVLPLERVEFNEQRAIRGMQVAHACNRLLL